MVSKHIPKHILDQLTKIFDPSSATFQYAVELLEKILRGERITWSEIRSSKYYYPARKLRKHNILIVVKTDKSYLVINHNLLHHSWGQE